MVNEAQNILTEKEINFYCNVTIIAITAIIVTYLLKRDNKDLDNLDTYDWTKFSIVGDRGGRYKKSETKDKPKQRIKEFSKGTGFIKEENRFPVLINEEKKESKFLTFEESNNFQDLINYAATMNNEKEQVYPIESLYNQVLTSPYLENNINANEKIDKKMNDILQNISMLDHSKTKEILNLYTELMKCKNRNLREQTYVGVVELFIRNGNLNHASYFLCQMDRLKINIPRNLLDMFLDYSINNRFFENKEEQLLYESKGFNRKTNSSNKFDYYNSSAPEFEYYFKNKNRYQSRIEDLNKVYKRLKLDSKPYVPKKISGNSIENSDPNINSEKKDLFAGVDPSKVKEYIPKNYRVVKVEENKKTLNL
mmetsp:Transcript_17650/g.18291  ORF Transcript_17650/g.18291 Transcript_17650/m.18291 type:complete len:367 (+) Transcript_17650:27-1127(+)|eukprot:CAMPEP_0170516972 /NCGR_PEP_ID=MMETSP0209-20121228/3077_1 /TAXON_ID=665100 ORGANISM="Litonotus pictus, Strain P1" /NCGR_SAMPLE_ID=MMETSP0209 /ASSEMBLY_ACC=CAM_ASM_000301 /LENGTH=366 /DNA_ID=CAMNT_0010802077 /DNA_START=24 /DNA_END=1124 /DNA_ORIENTATION=+